MPIQGPTYVYAEDEPTDCFLTGNNSVQLNQATVNKMVSYILKRYGHIAADAKVKFVKLDNNMFTFDINRDTQEKS